ncbi:hypothetical protein BDZ94DRAFT_1250917 [Collybia nuda]|uniref:DH domain-containing protein n=1 Tax=Collybia nuda TaxID=64659 RepID=A0A9P6CHU8_9AGAR|nr:hypothetical protein BDZ94DRAFT_1250917 [Collybia nuda]
MPIARSNTARNRSHSPLPPPSNGYSTFTRPFLPPSYYAAAAGISFSNSEKSSSRSEHSEFSEATPSISSKDGSGDPQVYHNTFMPVSYASESGATSDSSFEFRPSIGSQYSTSGGDRYISSSKTPVRSNRQSHITGLPQLETHLLPSLRDTIDRMTRTPSYTGPSSSPSGSTRLESLKTTESVLSMNTSPHPPSHSALVDDIAIMSRLPGSLHRSQPHLTTPVEPATPRLKTPMKSALKSALRAPTPRLFSNPSLGTEAVVHTPSGGVSLKSVRSMLSRKASSASLSETPTPSGTSGHKLATKKQTATPSFQYLRGRSRTDPGITRNSGPYLSSSKPAALSCETNYSTTSSDTTKQKLFNSSIPRLRNHLDIDCRTDDSDLDFQYEIQERERRKLVVANAEVFPSSSESETDAKERGWAVPAEAKLGKADWKSGLKSYGATNGIGLGLGLPGKINLKQKPISGGRETGDRRQTKNQFVEDGAGRWDTGNRATGTRSRSSAHDTYADLEPTSDTYLTSLDADHRRRREDLLGIVSGLDIQPSPAAVGESEESEYYGEDGFAISGSGDLGEASQSVQANFGSADPVNNGPKNNYGIRSWRASHETQRPSRPRSSSQAHLPTYVVSPDDEGSWAVQPSPSRRPRSTDQHSFPLLAATLGPSKGRKSSRSPVVRQDDLTPVPVALRRHSVYHRSPSPSAGERPPNDKKLLKKLDHDRNDTDALIITERSYAVAARERRAFGIPLSESVEVYQGVSDSGERHLTHADSDLSSMGSQYWDEDVDELSPGAETLFRKLSGGPIKEMERRRFQDDVDTATKSSVISRRSSVSSVYEDQNSEGRWQNHNQSYDPASEMINIEPLPTKGPLDKAYDNVEIQRCDLIQELCQSEEAFVNRLYIFVKLFILPLRVQDTKTWISGVPPEVARLFDWLDDILNLHRELLSSLQSNRTGQHSVFECIAASIHPFIPRLEVYQPYLVRLASVTKLIQQLVQDEKSDFGEFVDIQEGAIECDGWKFDKFLTEPITRLAQYPSFFSRLVELTPKTHPDYLSTFLLLHSTEMTIRVMTEVKNREDEYDLIKNFLSRIGGLSSGPQIATRERHLLFHGTLHLLTVDDEEVTILGNALFPANNPQNYVSATQKKKTNLENRTSRLANAVNIWDTRRGRSESTSSSNTGTSFETVSSRDTSCSTFFSSFRIPVPEGRLNAARISEQKRALESPSPNPRRPRTRGIPAQVFIFTDLMLLATQNSTLVPNNYEWSLLEGIGITRILGISEPPEQNSSENAVFVLDTLPIGKLNQCMSEEDGPVVTLRFLDPTIHHSLKLPEKPHLDAKANTWKSAFQQCFRFTLRSATLLSHSKGYGYDLYSDREHDTQQTVFSLLASGLPLPKSPSVQLDDFRHGQLVDIRKQEREERGWWSLRFQQVFRELQRQDTSVSL